MRNDQRFWTGGRPAVTRRQLLRGAGVAGLGLATAALIGCGDDDDDGGTAAPAATAAATTAATAAAADQPVVSESFQILQSRDAASLDPLASQIYTTPERIGLVYPRLVSVIRNPGDDLADTSQVPSWAVDSWEFSPDGATLTFHMREGVKYSNTPPVNGRELVADDVKYSIERYKSDPTSVFGPRFSDVNTIDAPDDYTATFNLFAPSAYLMYSLSAEPGVHHAARGRRNGRGLQDDPRRARSVPARRNHPGRGLALHEEPGLHRRRQDLLREVRHQGRQRHGDTQGRTANQRGGLLSFHQPQPGGPGDAR